MARTLVKVVINIVLVGISSGCVLLSIPVTLRPNATNSSIDIGWPMGDSLLHVRFGLLLVE